MDVHTETPARRWGIVDAVNGGVLHRKLTTAEAAHFLLTSDGCGYEVRTSEESVDGALQLFWGRRKPRATRFHGATEGEIFLNVVMSELPWHGNEAIDEAKMTDWWEFSPMSSGTLYGYDERYSGDEATVYADALNEQFGTADTTRHIHARQLSELDALELDLDQRGDDSVVNINDELLRMGKLAA
ncbi:hypothetical protein ACQZ46_23795 [Agrobacterium salinitolerans]